MLFLCVCVYLFFFCSLSLSKYFVVHYAHDCSCSVHTAALVREPYIPTYLELYHNILKMREGAVRYCLQV